MKIMWLTNILLNDFAIEINQKAFYGGGWMDSLSKDLSTKTDNELVICAPYNENNIVSKKIGNILYYAFPINNMELHLKNIYDEVKPDIVHIHGTEYSHGYHLMKVVPEAKYVVSIQGLVSIYAKHFYANVPKSILSKKTLGQVIINDSIKNGKKDFEKRGKIEEEIIKKVKYVIGRTTWDKACVYNINKNAQYFYCGESLRNSFYDNKWNINNIEKYTIFISQATYPIKGFHMFLEAFKDIIKDYPTAKVYVGGKNIINHDGFKSNLKRRYYDKYIEKLIKKYDLKDKVVFLGPLKEKEMCDVMKKSHVVVSPSAIENSPNSVGEALTLGVPVVASNVGGVSDIVTDKIDGLLYPFDETYMLRYFVEQIFSNDKLANDLSLNGIEKSKKLYDRINNMNNLIEIYKKIVEE